MEAVAATAIVDAELPLKNGVAEGCRPLTAVITSLGDAIQRRAQRLDLSRGDWRDWKGCPAVRRGLALSVWGQLTVEPDTSGEAGAAEADGDLFPSELW